MSSIKNFFKYFISKKFILNIIISVIFVIIVVAGTFWFLRGYTNHGQQFFTPNFKGLTIAEAEKLAKEKKLKIEVIDSTSTAHGEKGTVIDQTPAPNFMVKRGRTIFLTKKNVLAKRIAMPNLKNISLIQAKSEIESYSLLIGKLDYRPSKYINLVIEQKIDGQIIKPGTMIDVGTKIDLIVGEDARGSETKVPNLIGLNSEKASLLAAERSLNIGVAIYDNSVITREDTLDAFIYKQTPRKNWKADFGDEIDIWLTLNQGLLDN